MKNGASILECAVFHGRGLFGEPDLVVEEISGILVHDVDCRAQPIILGGQLEALAVLPFDTVAEIIADPVGPGARIGLQLPARVELEADVEGLLFVIFYCRTGTCSSSGRPFCR